jgi:predicted GIY-YIG superfamily endonuclease
MSNSRNTYKYHYKVGHKIVHSGVTNDLERREQEHQQKWPKGHIIQVGRKTTEDAALEWEQHQKKA